MALYKGISFLRYEYDKSLRLDDIQLVKNDIYNHIFTRKGERVKMPAFGSIISDVVFEPLDTLTLLKIEDDLTNIFNYDPRVELLELNIFPIYEKSTVYVSALLRYIELNLEERFDLNIEFKG